MKKQLKNKIFSTKFFMGFLFVSFLVSLNFVFSATKANTVTSLFATAATLIERTFPVIIGIAILYFLYGIIKYVSPGGSEKGKSDAKSHMIYGVLSIMVMVSLWGLVSMLINTFWSGGFGGLIKEIPR
ncbi:MAG: hypothetical protein H7831_08100 [Magnetococcus sp. WYHC-3]